MPLWCNAWEHRKLERERCFLPPVLALRWADGWSYSDYSRFVELNGGVVALTKKLFQFQKSSSRSCTYSLTQPNMKICSVNRDVLLWLHTPLCSSANPKGNACQTLPPLYRCATCALTLSCVGESTSQHWDIALLFFVNSDKQCQLRFVTVPSKDEHPNPTDLNLNPFVNTEHPFPALCS